MPNIPNNSEAAEEAQSTTVGVALKTTVAADSDKTLNWTQMTTTDKQQRLSDVFGFLASDSARCCVAIWFGLQAFDKNSIPMLSDEDGVVHLNADAREKYRALEDHSYVGAGDRVTWKQSAPEGIVKAMEKRLPQASSTPARARAFMILGLVGVEIGIGMGEAISEQAFQILGSNLEKNDKSEGGS